MGDDSACGHAVATTVLGGVGCYFSIVGLVGSSEFGLSFRWPQTIELSLLVVVAKLNGRFGSACQSGCIGSATR